jgi:hypothetical protein
MRMPKLRDVDVVATKLTKAKADEIMQARPDLVIFGAR